MKCKNIDVYYFRLAKQREYIFSRQINNIFYKIYLDRGQILYPTLINLNVFTYLVRANFTCYLCNLNMNSGSGLD